MKPYKVSDEDVRRFKEERARFRLLYRCQDCVYHVPGTNECSMGFPNKTLLESERYLEESGQFVFCKYFEVN